MESHVSRILTKMYARGRTQLVVISYKSGLVVPDGAGEVSAGRAGS